MVDERRCSVMVSTFARRTALPGSLLCSDQACYIRCKNLALKIVGHVYFVGRGSSVVGAPLQNQDKFVYPVLPVSFGGDTVNRWSFLSGVNTRRSKISHTRGLNV